MQNEFKKEEIKEIALNPRFCINGEYETLKNQGFSVHWMTEDDLNIKSMYAIIIEEND